MSAAACPLCGGTGSEPALEAGEARLVRCRACGLVRTAAAPAAGYDAAYYSAHELADELGRDRPDLRSRVLDRAYRAFLDPASPALERLWLLPLRNRVGGLPPRGARGDLLDVGSGDGGFMYRARAHGWRVSGVAVNAAAVASARAAGLDVREGELAGAGFEPGSFDLVRLWHVLEHLPDPVGTLATARELLRPGGLLVVGVPDFDSPVRGIAGAAWSGLQPSYHLNHFDRRTLRATAERAGFRVLRLRHRSVGTAYSTLAATRPGLANPLSWAVLLLADDLLDLAGRGDAFELVATPA